MVVCQCETTGSSERIKTGCLRFKCSVVGVENLTVASTHPAIVVGHSDEVVATGSSVGVDQELRHVQVSAGNT